MKSTSTLLLFAFILITQTLFDQDKNEDNIKITNDFFKAYEQLDFDQMSSYWHDSVAFNDVIASELYGIKDTYLGRQTILTLWKQAFSKKPDYIRIDIKEQFATGHFVVSDMSFENSTTNEGKTVIIKGEMITVFEFRDGKIIKHFDFGDYASWARQTASLNNNKGLSTEQESYNASVASEYMAAYSNKDVAKMSEYYDSAVEFKDLTANDFFNSTDYEKTGKEAVSQFWQGVLIDSKAKYSKVKVNGLFSSASYVILNTTFSMILPSSWTGGNENVFVSIPIKTILQIKNGKVHKHWDFADYKTYQKQIALQTAG